MDGLHVLLKSHRHAAFALISVVLKRNKRSRGVATCHSSKSAASRRPLAPKLSTIQGLEQRYHSKGCLTYGFSFVLSTTAFRCSNTVTLADRRRNICVRSRLTVSGLPWAWQNRKPASLILSAVFLDVEFNETHNASTVVVQPPSIYNSSKMSVNRCTSISTVLSIQASRR